MWRGIVVSTIGCYARGPRFKSRETQTFLRKTTSIFFLTSLYNYIHVLIFVRCVILISVVNLINNNKFLQILKEFKDKVPEDLIG